VYPILNVGPAAIQLPGLVLLLGFWLSLNIAGRRAKAAGLSEDVVFNAGMIALLSGLIGARLGYVALHWSAYQQDLQGVVSLTAGALSTPVGLLVGGGAAALYLRRRHPPLPVPSAMLKTGLLDALAPGLALMFAFISLADLSAGSAYGAVSDLPWAIELWGARRHPTQLYELLAALVTLGLLWWARARRPYNGFLFLLSLLVYGAARTFVDAFRADPWLLPGGYRAVQVLGLGAVVLSLWLMSRRAVRPPVADVPNIGYNL
jgi:phosphatidylglycerol:prolipoprotein diacylglycerol transferase